MNHIRLFNIFRKQMHLTDENAEEAVLAVQEVAGLALESKFNLLATKEDLNSLRLATKEDLNSLRLATKEDLNAFKSEVHLEFKSVRKEIYEVSGKLQRTIYISGFIQFLAMMGTVLAAFKLIK